MGYGRVVRFFCDGVMKPQPPSVIARARVRSLKKMENKMRWAFRGLDLEVPEDLHGEELLRWARVRLMALSEHAEKDQDAIAALRTLVTNADAELERASREKANQAQSAPTSINFASLPPEEQDRAIELAEEKLRAAKAIRAQSSQAGLLGGKNGNSGDGGNR